ncbi:hypothetical protein D3C71_1963300 [compost metagenome]
MPGLVVGPLSVNSGFTVPGYWLGQQTHRSNGIACIALIQCTGAGNDFAKWLGVGEGRVIQGDFQAFWLPVQLDVGTVTQAAEILIFNANLPAFLIVLIEC